MPTRTAFIITIGDVLESGPPRTSRSTASKNHNPNSESDDSSSVASRPHSPASSTYSDAPRPRRFRKRNRMKTRVSNTGGSSANAVAASNTASTTSASATSNGVGSNGRRSRLQSIDQVYLGNSNNNPLSPRTRSSVKQEIDDEVSFV